MQPDQPAARLVDRLGVYDEVVLRLRSHFKVHPSMYPTVYCIIERVGSLMEHSRNAETLAALRHMSKQQRVFLLIFCPLPAHDARLFRGVEASVAFNRRGFLDRYLCTSRLVLYLEERFPFFWLAFCHDIDLTAVLVRCRRLMAHAVAI